MLKAGSLLYSIFIALIISAIASSFILINYYQNLRIAQSEGNIQAISRIESAMNLLKVASVHEVSNETIKLFEDDIFPTSIQLHPWGAYFLATAKTSFRQSNFQQSTLQGYRNEAPFAIYLAENNMQLSISGDTKLVGTAFLPLKGVKRAYIEGRTYTGTKLIYGEEKRSNKELPKLNRDLLNYLKQNLMDGIPNGVDEVVTYSGSQVSKVQSFQDSTFCIYSIDPIHLLLDSLKGRIVVKSEVSIYIDNQSYIEDVILIAPKIVIQAGFIGTVHLIASDSIVVQPLSQLKYPSSILLSSSHEESAIVLGEGSSIEGEVILEGDENNLNNMAIIEISENVEIIGNVFCFDKVELKGNVKGSVTCRKFLLRTKTSIYENFILNGSINNFELPNKYLGVQWDNTVRIKETIKWVN